MYDRILVAVDGSPTADRAMSEAIQLASKLGAELVIAHVIDNAYLKYDVGYIDIRGLTETLIEQENGSSPMRVPRPRRPECEFAVWWWMTRSGRSISVSPSNKRPGMSVHR